MEDSYPHLVEYSLCLLSGLSQNSSTVFVNDSKKKSNNSFCNGVAHFLMYPFWHSTTVENDLINRWEDC